MQPLAQQVTASLNLTLPALIALGAGILVLARPKWVHYVVGVYLIVFALIQLFDITI